MSAALILAELRGPVYPAAMAAVLVVLVAVLAPMYRRNDRKEG